MQSLVRNWNKLYNDVREKHFMSFVLCSTMISPAHMSI